MNAARPPLYTALTLILLLALAALLYRPGLAGGFMFDDIVHVSKNTLIAITDFSPRQLLQAWNSSPFEFPFSRPLSMLSFGLNHALGGMEPFGFKLGNLLIHLLAGVGIFGLCRMAGGLHLRILGLAADTNQLDRWALLAAALWLLSPLNLSPVLYVVQRMTSLSALFTLLAMIGYVHGRARLYEGRGGYLPILLGTPALGALAFLAKENGALLFLLLFAMEFSLFRFKTATAGGTRFLKAFFLVTAIIPVASALAFLVSHPNWIVGGYARRGFTLSERLLTEARVLWFYLQMLFVPDYTQLGFYHDDFTLSKGWLKPPTTLMAVMGVVALLLYGLLARNKTPLISFGILFFLVGHSMESSVIALELVYEHRNYLPSVGPFIALAYYLTATSQRRMVSLAALALATVSLAFFAITTARRSTDWSSETSLTLVEAKHHPDSPRATFRAGQTLIGMLPNSKEPETTYRLARQYLERTVELNPSNADGLFGLIVLHLHTGRPVEKRWLGELKHRLEHIPYNPQNISTAQFSYLVKWHMADGPKLPPEEVLGIFEAVLRNREMDNFARGGIESALRAYYQEVLKDPETALTHARIAVQSWPQHWHYRQRLIELLVELKRYQEAERQLTEASALNENGVYAEKVAELQRLIQGRQRPRQDSTAIDTEPTP